MWIEELKNWYGASLPGEMIFVDVYTEFVKGIFCFFILSNNASSVIHILKLMLYCLPVSDCPLPICVFVCVQVCFVCLFECASVHTHVRACVCVCVCLCVGWVGGRGRGWPGEPVCEALTF